MSSRRATPRRFRPPGAQGPIGGTRRCPTRRTGTKRRQGPPSRRALSRRPGPRPARQWSRRSSSGPPSTSGPTWRGSSEGWASRAATWSSSTTTLRTGRATSPTPSPAPTPGSMLSTGSVRSLGTPDARRFCGAASRISQRLSVVAGAPFPLVQFLQHEDVECLLGHDPLQPRVLLLQQLQPLRLVPLDSPIPQPPAVEGLVGDPNPLRRPWDGHPLALQLLDLPAFGDRLLHRVPLTRHQSPHLVLTQLLTTTFVVDQFSGGRHPGPGGNI